MCGLIASAVAGKTQVVLRPKRKLRSMQSRSSEVRKGGPRKGAGAKPIYAEAMVRFQVMLDAVTVEKLKVLGDGNLSAGIREAAKRVRRRK